MSHVKGRERVKAGEIRKKAREEFQLVEVELRVPDVQSPHRLSLRDAIERMLREVNLFRYIPLLYCLAGLLLCITLVL